MRYLALAGLLTGLVNGATFAKPKLSCEQFGSELDIPNVTVNFATHVPAGTKLAFSQDYGLRSCRRPSQVVDVDLCRVAMYVATSNRSGITLEAWLPADWSGRFLSSGNSVLSGCIQYEDLAYGSSLGFATVGANNGHNGTKGLALGENEDILRDFVDRSMHTGVLVGKQLTEKFYGSAHHKSYYLGCSTGGRQGFKAVQTYPEDFDGVVVGAPALNFPSLISWNAHFYTILGKEGDPNFVSPVLWRGLIHIEVLHQCDGIDGALDGIIEDPSLCHFNPETLLCPSESSDTTSCLTPVQVSAVRKVYEDYYGADGELIYPRLQPGAEQMAATVLFRGKPFPYSEDWFRYVVYKNASWDAATYSVQDAQVAIEQDPFNISTWNGDLSAFESKGGKILHYHGQADAIITSNISPMYYDRVSSTMGKTPAELDDFYRLFRVSGMGHCIGGDGAHFIGNQAETVSTADPQNNVLLRMVDWVENGNAPETITGTRYINDDKSQGVELVRNHCKYPKRNVCIDKTNDQKAEAWECV
ncbi:hypothetical protein BUE80_DR000526 [Diplocarpon rosae]|nr:hypothetical protein BUE80_DR000526 [Diplocarpon rosae]